jgi:hypothetical protein
MVALLGPTATAGTTNVSTALTAIGSNQPRSR